MRLSGPLGVSLNYLKEFKQQHLTHAGENLTLNRNECMEEVVIPRAREGLCSLASLEGNYRDSKGNVHSGLPSVLWVYSREIPLANLIEAVEDFTAKRPNSSPVFHYIDVFCDNLFIPEKEQIANYQEALSKVDLVVVYLDNPITPFFPQSFFATWTIYLALKSSTKVLFTTTKSGGSRLTDYLVEKYENIFLLTEKIRLPRKISKGQKFEEYCSSQLRGTPKSKALLLSRKAFEKWIFRICKKKINAQMEKEHVGFKALVLAFNVGCYLLAQSEQLESEFYLSFCFSNSPQSESFSRKMGIDTNVKYAQLVTLAGDPDKGLEIANVQLSSEAEMTSWCRDNLYTLLLGCCLRFEDLDQAVHWSKKLTNHKRNEVASIKLSLVDAGMNIDLAAPPNETKSAKRPEDFNQVQREYKSTLSEEDKFSLAQIEAAEQFTYLGHLQMKSELHEDAVESYRQAVRMYCDLYGKIDPLVTRSKGNLDEAKFKAKVAAK